MVDRSEEKVAYLRHLLDKTKSERNAGAAVLFVNLLFFRIDSVEYIYNYHYFIFISSIISLYAILLSAEISHRLHTFVEQILALRAFPKHEFIPLGVANKSVHLPRFLELIFRKISRILLGAPAMYSIQVSNSNFSDQLNSLKGLFLRLEISIFSAIGAATLAIVLLSLQKYNWAI